MSERYSINSTIIIDSRKIESFIYVVKGWFDANVGNYVVIADGPFLSKKTMRAMQ